MTEPFNGAVFKARLLKHLTLFQDSGLYSAVFIYGRLVAFQPTPPEIAYDSLHLTSEQGLACSEVEALMKERFSIRSNYDNGIVCLGGHRQPTLVSTKQEVNAIEYLELLATVAAELDLSTREKFESVLELIYENGVRPITNALRHQKASTLN
jgi:hypothetical protein